MTVPAPRGGEAGQEQETTTVLGILVATTRRIEDTVARGFESINLQLSKLPETYVARREFDRYRDETSLDWQQAQQKHDRDVGEIRAAQERDRAAREERERQEQAARDAREAQERRDRLENFRWRWGLLGAAVVSLAGAVISHIPFH